MADFRNVAKGLLGDNVSDKQIDALKIKLLSYPEGSEKANRINSWLTFMVEQVEPQRPNLSKEELKEIYSEARQKLVEITGGITGFFGPEGSKKKG